MSCETCYTKDEQIRELEAKVRYLESQEKPTIDRPPFVDWLNNRYSSARNKHE